MQHSALDIIIASLKRLGVLSGTETPTADLAQDALDRMNGLIETWETESLTAPTKLVQIVQLVASQEAYTIGNNSPDVIAGPTTTPARILDVNVILPGGHEIPLQPLDDEAWIKWSPKSLPGAQATHFYWQLIHPAIQLRVWPIYSGGPADKLAVYGQGPYAFPLQIPSLTTVIDWPRGYYRALRDNLAIELAPEVGREVPGALLASAQEALAQLKRFNHRPVRLHLPPELPGLYRGGYNWLTDEWAGTDE